MNDSLQLFSVTHKRVENIPQDRVIIGVGEQRDCVGAVVTDGTGDNICEKNNSFCELTALYWIWKNVSCGYVGLEHYRRFFYSNKKIGCRILTKLQIEHILRQGKIILPKPQRYEESVYEHYKKFHNISDLDICLRIIAEDFPEYIPDCDAVMKAKELSIANMFVMPKQMADNYCTWLFHVLFKAEKQIQLYGRDPYQARVFGFLSERLFNIWLHHLNIKPYYALVFGADDNVWKIRVSGKFKKILHIGNNK